MKLNSTSGLRNIIQIDWTNRIDNVVEWDQMLQWWVSVKYHIEIELTVPLSFRIDTTNDITKSLKPYPNLLAVVETVLPSTCSLKLKNPKQQDKRHQRDPTIHLPLGESVSCARVSELLVSNKWRWRGGGGGGSVVCVVSVCVVGRSGGYVKIYVKAIVRIDCVHIMVSLYWSELFIIHDK